MTDMRRWGTWPGRIVRQLVGVSGLAAVGGIALGVWAWMTLPRDTAVMLAGGGAAIVVAAIAYAMWRAVPPLVKPAERLVGQTIPLSELERVFPPILRLAVVGPTHAGKTTLKNQLSFQAGAAPQAQTATAYIAAVPSSPPGYLAVLDAGGISHPQQFKIAEACDFLCIVLDHNPSDSLAELSASRLKEQEVFLKRLRRHLVDTKARRKRRIEILINKRDLWQAASPEERTVFEQFYAKEVRTWKDGRFADAVAAHTHSNRTAKDVDRFMNVMISVAQPGNAG